MKIQVSEFGRISAHSENPENTLFRVPWTEGSFPEMGEYDATVSVAAVFDQTPTAEEIQAKLKIGAFQPSVACTANCDGDVKAYYSSAIFDTSTVFEYNGRFYKNVESVVSVEDEGITYTFRNPPVFIPVGSLLDDRAGELAALAEIDCAVDYLAYHPNTKSFFGRRMIQHFVTSNPSPEYVRDVGQAFETGRYESEFGSGMRGDLGATLAAVLLHPDARTRTSGSNGRLREPLLKFLHYLRSMEYEHGSKPIITKKASGKLGEYAYMAPDVFSFFNPDFVPDDFEPEEGVIVAKEEDLTVGPEFQLFISPYAMQFLNAMSGVIENGVTYCGPRSSVLGLGAVSTCKMGEYHIEDTGDVAMIEKLDVLLTGGRLTPLSLETVRAAYENAPEGRQLKEAQFAIVCSPEFHNMGPPMPLGLRPASERTVMPPILETTDTAAEPATGKTPQQERQEEKLTKTNAKAAAQAEKKEEKSSKKTEKAEKKKKASLYATSALTSKREGEDYEEEKPYKAIVVLHLGGGADTYHMIVPIDCPLYNEYAARRGALAFKQNDIIEIETTGQQCQKFGLHPSFKFLASLYKNQEAAFVANMGSLVLPLTAADYQYTAAERPNSLFDHSRQGMAAATLKCQIAGASPKGVGGRILDRLMDQYNTRSFSIQGETLFNKGAKQTVETVSATYGTVSLKGYDKKVGMITNMTQQKFGNIYLDEFASLLEDYIGKSEYTNRLVSKLELQTGEYPQETRLGKQLYQVAKLIAARIPRKAERDVFFVKQKGFDTHKDLQETLTTEFDGLDNDLSSFVGELKAQGSFESTVFATVSEFGRKIDYNGHGTDHGWSGNYFVLGGGINGGKVYNEYLNTFIQGNNAYEIGRGRVIPKYPWESMWVPIAKWMGVDVDDEDAAGHVFPNLHNFNRSQFIISDLFD